MENQIYLVTNQPQLFNNPSIYSIMSPKESLDTVDKWGIVQADSETNGKDAHINDFLCVQLGNDTTKQRLVIDTSTVDIRQYKDLLESKYLIFQNAKFDLQFLYNYGIHPTHIYDTMIVEQFLYQGFPYVGVSPEDYERYNYHFPYHIIEDEKGNTMYKLNFALDALAQKRCNIHLDKSVRGEIIYRGLDTKVIEYAANDVVWLEKIMQSQLEDLKKIPNALIGAKIECDFTPVIAYLEWCGIKMDTEKWKAKMAQDKINLEESIKALNEYCMTKPQLSKWVKTDRQGDLFSGFDLTPRFNIDWQKKEAIQVFKALGFDVKTTSKKTGKNTESKTEKLIASQKGIDDEFLRLYFGQGEEDDDDYFPGYSGSYKVVTSFGQGHLNAINPNTGRIHTVYKAIGAVSGRMSSGSDKPNTDLAKLKKLPADKCTYPNMQQLPKNAMTRGCFISEKGNLFCSCDYSAMEARIGAEVYNEHKLLDEFLYGSGDTHAAYAKAVFSKELEGIETKDIKKKRPDLRSKVKSIEFAVQFGSDGTAVAPQLKIPVEEARQLVINLLNGMTGLKKFKNKWSKFVLDNGYMPIMPQTGHRAYWYDWNHWKDVQASMTEQFWDDYRTYHKDTGDEVAQMVREHYQAKSKWCDRMSLNLPTQGGGAVVLKEAAIALYKWVIDNGYWGKILFVNFTHDEINTEFPEELKDTYPKIVAKIMQEAAAKYYHKLPIPAEPAVGDHWIH